MFSLDAEWNALATTIESDGTEVAELRVHPLSLGAGIGFRF